MKKNEEHPEVWELLIETRVKRREWSDLRIGVAFIPFWLVLLGDVQLVDVLLW